MQNKFTKDEIEKALEQAEANLKFEEVNLKQLINEKNTKQKTFRKEPKK